MKSLGFPMAALRTIELGFVRDSYRWIGYDNSFEEGSISLDTGTVQDNIPRFFTIKAFSLAGSLMIT